MDRLRGLYQAETELTYENPFQLLIATILSAQTTDRSVNLVTPELNRPDGPRVLQHFDE